MNTEKTALKVLLVEDEEIIQEIHTMMLHALDCEVILAKDGNEALHYAMYNNYDIIFMDINLPDINGIDVTKKIRADKNFKSNSSNIIALTCFVEDRLKKECLKAGMNLIEKKPINTIRLQQICFSKNLN
jgi:CheY-like chemotaxis protein